MCYCYVARALKRMKVILKSLMSSITQSCQCMK